jgi:LEA14-like dessication related protein
MNDMRLIFLLCVLMASAGCTSTAVVDVYLTNITPMPSTLFEQRARLELRVQNLSEEPLEATGIDVDLRLNGKRLARGVDGTGFTVPRLGETITSVVVSSSVFDTITQLLTLQGRDVFTYGLKGRVITPGIDKRFSRGGQLSRADLQPLVSGNSASK